jgi:hypothetical protein
MAAGVLVVEGGRLRVVRPLLGDAVARAILGLDPPGRLAGETSAPGGAPGPAG